MAIEVIGPETTFEEDAARLFARINELETFGAPKKRIRKAREYVNKALSEMDAAYAALR